MGALLAALRVFRALLVFRVPLVCCRAGLLVVPVGGVCPRAVCAVGGGACP